MAFIPAPNILMVEVRATKDGQQIENRFYVNCLHEPVMADIVAVNAIVVTSITNDWLANLPTDVGMRSVFYRSMEDANAIQLEVPLPLTFVGTKGGAPAPNQNTVCISLRTGSAGRSARGRLYWLGLSEGQFSVNTMVTADLGAIVATLEDMRAELAAANYPWTIVSFIANGAPRPGGPVYFPVTTVLAVDDTLDSQRRRMPGRGT